MKISIFGLGYVGAVSAGCLAKNGNTVIGVDPSSSKVDLINEGRTPIIEKDIDTIISNAVEAGKLSATQDPKEAIAKTDISLICVGTPSMPNGSLNLSYVRNVCEEIGEALKEKASFHVVVIRSTMLPGTMLNVVIPTIEKASGMVAGEGFGICGNPEFLRESTAVFDFYNPPKTVIGESDTKSGDILSELYAGLDAPLIRTSIETAEMVKYTDNVWHALKVGFANEIGSICKSVGIDSHEVMKIFFQDTKLNISPYYMKPGFAFGGSCLPKDLRALTYKAKSMDVNVPILNSILPSNQIQVDRGFQAITSKGKKKIGVLGFSFKSGTDDLRESPIVEVIERLLGKGYDIKIFDNNVNIAKIVGANKDFILNAIPHISNLMVNTPEEIIEHSEVVVIGNGATEFKELIPKLSKEQTMIDLVRIVDEHPANTNYDGINW
ncbi:nucleotide sugar dehydrogenase [Pelagicoccus albus]|uniref:UDP-glucose 6-dehydrogenase n=1 Tax=Pelagicoccus albus TaxID=415222 RepID=A0A7X1EA85_9BACT|nr:UDP-glucose/GDP-mannose dehydrogenase family protein [Pelagicoccus albus]MBC2608239.1 UDP-glucose/GDP-mannose dehydrogenase family protein [Pelagicoccus albus]